MDCEADAEYVPVAHCEQTDRPDDAAKLPALQGEQVMLPFTVLAVPGTQGVHFDWPDDDGLEVPGGHARHADCPGCD